MERDHIQKTLDRIKAERNTPQALVDMFDALASLPPGLTTTQKIDRFDKIISETLKRLERRDA